MGMGMGICALLLLGRGMDWIERIWGSGGWVLEVLRISGSGLRGGGGGRESGERRAERGGGGGGGSIESNRGDYVCAGSM